MSLSPTALLERQQLTRSQKRNSIASILIIGGVILVLLFTLLTLALPVLEETFQEDQTSFLEMGVFPWFVGHFVAASLHGGLVMLVLIMIIRLEYLRGHIGEKRFVHSRLQFTASGFQFDFVWRLYFIGPPFYSSVRLPAQGNATGPVFVRDRSTRFRAKKVHFHFIGGF